MTDAPQLGTFFNLVSLGEIDSTSAEARRRAAAGAVDGTVIWAERQTAGRGRRGRAWVSPDGNLYVSFILKPECAPDVAAQLGFAAALAVAEAIRGFLPSTASIACKWPNDVLVDGRKIAGILLESQAAAGGGLDWIVVGIGINLATAPAETEFPATSLAATGRPDVFPSAMLAALAASLQHWYEVWGRTGFASIRAAWLDLAYGLADPVRVRLDSETLEGRFGGLDVDGALLLEMPAGRRRITAGDVFPVRGA